MTATCATATSLFCLTCGRHGAVRAVAWRPSLPAPRPGFEPGVRLLKLNADAAQATVARLGVRGIPALVLFRDGAVLAQSAGARDAAAIVAWTEANRAGSAAVTAT